jgi:hypothetical protein
LNIPLISTTRLAVRALIAAVIALAPLPANGRAALALPPANGSAVSAHVNGAEDRRPLAFEVNRGQVDSRVAFLARAGAYTVFLTPAETVVSLGDGRSPDRAVIRMKLAGANPSPSIHGERPLIGRTNYAGRGAGASGRQISPVDSSGQQIGGVIDDVPTYARVRYAGVLPGVDLVFYGAARLLEYDVIVAAGADPGAIALGFEGVDRVEIDPRGDLVLHTAAGKVRQPPPVIYQEIEGARRPVAGGYALDGDGRVRFRLGAYDASVPLVIDPVLAYSTYLGGSWSEGHFGAAGIAVDSAGNTYVTGTTQSVDFPTTAGAGQTPAGGQDIFVTKFSPTGTVIYSTYLGGPCDDIARGIAVDLAGNAYITGRVEQTNCYWGAIPGALVAKLGPTGALVYSRTFGGALVETSTGHAIAVDGSGHIYVVGTTSAADFPTTPGAFQTVRCADVWGGLTSDGFAMKVSPDGSSLVYSTFLCGTGDDVPAGIAVDAGGHAHIAGTTGSHDFPTENPLQPAHGSSGASGVTGFIAKLAPDGSHLVYSTYLGGSTRDLIEGLALDGQGNVYVTGSTQSTDYPTTPGVLQEHSRGNSLSMICGYAAICYSAFITKINAGGSALVYSTYLYGEANHGASGIAVDGAGHAHVVGWTNSSYFPIKDAFQPANRGLDDAFVARLSPDGTRLIYSSYLGGSHVGPSSLTGSDVGSAIALDAAGNAHVVGYALSYDFPTTPGAFQPELGGEGPCDFYNTPCSDAFVARITAGGPGVTPAIRIAASPGDVAPGGTVTATWAGLAPPTGCDYIVLNALGSGRNDFLGYWLTPGTAAGSLAVPLPADLPAGSYELRLLTPEPGSSCYTHHVVARSEPFRVAPAAADLVVTGVAWTPVQPIAGQVLQVNVTVANQGTAAAGSFAVDFYKHLATAPSPGTAGDVRCTIAGLAPQATVQCTGAVTYAAAGSFTAWAQVDTAQTVVESSEGDNVLGPRAMAVAAPVLRPDLVEIALTSPPAQAKPGTGFSVSHTVRNQGTATAGSSKTRFHLSLDTQKSAGDRLLTGVHAVPSLAPGATSSRTLTVTVPTGTPSGTYFVLACADDIQAVAEDSEANNCRASAGTVTVALPDLVQQSVSSPGGPFKPRGRITVSDTVFNDSPLASGKSATKYYFSVDGSRSAGDKLLTGSRTVASLAAFTGSSGSVTLTIPASTAPRTYTLLACADAAGALEEASETNNCRASATPVVVAP